LARSSRAIIFVSLGLLSVFVRSSALATVTQLDEYDAPSLASEVLQNPEDYQFTVVGKVWDIDFYPAAVPLRYFVTATATSAAEQSLAVGTRVEISRFRSLAGRYYYAIEPEAGAEGRTAWLDGRFLRATRKTKVE